MSMHSSRSGRRRRWPAAAGALSILLGAAAPATAQGVPDTLRLEDALALAREGNPDLRQAAREPRRAAAVELARWGAFLPEVAAEGQMVDATSRTVTARNEFGQPVELENPARFSSTAAVASIGASLTLFDGLRRVNELRAARAGARGAASFAEEAGVRVASDVRRRFYAAVAADRLVAVEERLLSAAEDRLSATETMAIAGRATPHDVLGAEVELARQQMSLEAARGEAYAARLALATLIGAPGEPAFVVAGDLPHAELPDSLAADPLVQRAIATNPRVLRADAATSRAAHLADAARGARWPTLRVSARYAREVSLADPAQLTSYPWNRGVVLGLSAGIPLFSGFSTTARTAEARVAEENAADDLRRTRLAVERDVRAGLMEVQLARRAVLLAERAAELSGRRLETGQEGFRRGLIGFTQLQQMIEQAAQAERSAVRARLGFVNAVVALEEAVGEPVLTEPGH